MLKLIKKRSGEAKTPKTGSKAAAAEQEQPATAQVIERASSASNVEKAPAVAPPAKPAAALPSKAAAIEPAKAAAAGGNGKAAAPAGGHVKAKKLESLQALRYITALQVRMRMRMCVVWMGWIGGVDWSVRRRRPPPPPPSSSLAA